MSYKGESRARRTGRDRDGTGQTQMGTVQGRMGRGKLGDFYHVKGKRGQGYWSRIGERVEAREVMQVREDLFVWKLCETLHHNKCSWKAE